MTTAVSAGAYPVDSHYCFVKEWVPFSFSIYRANTNVSNLAVFPLHQLLNKIGIDFALLKFGRIQNFLVKGDRRR